MSALTVVRTAAKVVVVLEYEVPLFPLDGIVAKDMSTIPAEHSVDDRVHNQHGQGIPS